MDISNLKPTERRILQFVAANPAATRTEIAKNVKLSRQHVSVLMNQAPLSTAITEPQQGQIAENGRLAVGAAALALTCLIRIVSDTTASNNERIRAASVILTYTAHAPEPPSPPETYRVDR